METLRNALVIYGGGLADPAKVILLLLARNIFDWNFFQKVFIGKYSFMSLIYDSFQGEDLLCEYSRKFEEKMMSKRNGCFGTSRGIRFDESTELFEQAITHLKKNNITNIYLVGGDGTARFAANLSEKFSEHGIYVSFMLPITIDGINGGESVGLEQATRISVNLIAKTVSTSLMTIENMKFGVVVVELQGRDRDDILANVLKVFTAERHIADFNLNDLTIYAVPANLFTDIDEMVRLVNASSKRTLILVSEGARQFENLRKAIHGRKVRVMSVGHVSQVNQETRQEDVNFYSKIVEDIVSIAHKHIDESITIVKSKEDYRVESINYFAHLNPEKSDERIIASWAANSIIPYMVCKNNN